jgi:hypothetical protein
MTPNLTVADVEVILGKPLSEIGFSCHSVSLAIVKSGFYPKSRVARGRCRGVPSQHSWVVIGTNCFSPTAQIVDATLWLYDRSVDQVWLGNASQGRHVSHGSGSIWQYGMPSSSGGEVISLQVDLSYEASAFLDLLGPLDYRGWAQLAHAPVGGWPAREIIEAMLDTPRVAALPPIDVVGMLTDRNPNGLYF